MSSAGRLRFGRSASSDLSVNFGFKTPPGWGAYTVSEAPGGVITSSNGGASDWVIDAQGRLAPSGTYGTTSAPKAFSKAAGETYNLTLPSGRKCNVTLVANTVHIRDNPGDSSSSNQARMLSGRAYNLSGALRLGDTVIWRDDATFSSLSSAWSIQPPAAGYAGAGTITAGTGYVNGTYQNVPLTTLTGVGTGAVARITVAGGVIANVHINVPGTGYVAGDTLSASNTNLGGSGSGFVFTVTNLDGRITWRGETPDTSTHADGWPTQGGLFNAIYIGISGDLIGASMAPYDFRYITFYAASAPISSCGLQHNGTNATTSVYGASSYNCRFAINLAIPVASRNKTAWQQHRCGTVENCTFEGFERAITGGRDPAILPSAALQTIIRNNIWTVVSGDGNTYNPNTIGWLVEDNFAYSTVYTTGEHPDVVQHQGYPGVVAGGSGYTQGTYTSVALKSADGLITTTATQIIVNSSGVVTTCTVQDVGTLPAGTAVVMQLTDPAALGASGTGFTWTSPGTITSFGTWRRNIFVRGSSSVGQIDAQGYFYADGRGNVRIEDAIVENNIYIGTLVNGIVLTKFRNPQVTRNTIIAAVGVSGVAIPLTAIDLDRGDDGVVTGNIANQLSYADQGGVITLTNNTSLANTQSAYDAMFSAFGFTATTAAAARLLVAPKVGVPVASGGAMNPDGTYRGAVFPNGSWNDGSVY